MTITLPVAILSACGTAIIVAAICAVGTVACHHEDQLTYRTLCLDKRYECELHIGGKQ